MVNKPLIRPYLGVLVDIWLTCHSRFLLQENHKFAHVQLILRLCWCSDSRYALDRRSERVDEFLFVGVLCGPKGLKETNQHWMNGILNAIHSKHQKTSRNFCFPCRNDFESLALNQ